MEYAAHVSVLHFYVCTLTSCACAPLWRNVWIPVKVGRLATYPVYRNKSATLPFPIRVQVYREPSKQHLPPPQMSFVGGICSSELI